MLTEPQARKLTAAVLAAGKKLAKDAALSVSMDSGRAANTRFARSEITSTGDVDDTTLTVGVGFGKRHAQASTNQTDAPALLSVLQRAIAMARLAPEDPELMPLLGPQKYASTPPGFDRATAELPASARAEAAHAAIAAADAAKVDLAGFHDLRGAATALANSAGLFAYHAATGVSFTCTARTPDGTGSGWGQGYANRWSDLDTVAAAKVAIDKSVAARRPRKLDPGRYTVVLEPAAVGDLLYFLVSALDARRADEGRSFFSRQGGGTRVGEQLWGPHITLRSDPASKLMPSAPFDGEGLPQRPITWIDKGKIAALRYSRFWAEKQGQRPTAAPSVTELAGGDATPEALLAGVKRGVLITRFWYNRWVDPQSILITGLTRDGVFLIEDGKVVAPVNNFRYNESPVKMLKNADALGKDAVRLATADGRMRVPALRTHEFNLASTSDAV
ncbi:MAG: TldD/PmbA family protein [Deltaproteobacteria bacterium]|nr:TldD/PmbA family protein [Deltaproteobacteria bacterium]